MFFDGLIQRKLASLLRPWLREEPELELKLGILRSHGIARNLCFDTTALNLLLDESDGLSFKDVRVEQLSLRISSWSSTAFRIEVHGVHISLSLNEVSEDRGSRRRQKDTDTSRKNLNRVLSEIDPEGFALHEAIKRISEIISLRNRKTSLVNTVLRHCQLSMHDIHLQLQFPICNDSFSWLWDIKEINASHFVQHGCFLRGFIGSLVMHSRESSFNLDIIGSEIGLKEKDRITTLFPSADMITSFNLMDLQLVNFKCCFPELKFNFSASDLSIILAFNSMSSKVSDSPRDGRQLWRIASSRISSLISVPRLSFYRAVDIVCLWLRYAHAYEDLLLHIGYPADNKIKKSVAMMSQDKIFSRSVKHLWKAISEIEEELPAEAIAQARKISRVRVASQSDGTVKVSSESLKCINLYVEKLSITLSPAIATLQPLADKIFSDFGISNLELLSFSLSIDSFFLRCTEDVCEQGFCFSCGNLKVVSTSFTEDGSNNNLKGRPEKKIRDSETNLWGEPAPVSYLAEAMETNSATNTTEISLPLLKQLIRQTWFNWKSYCTQFELREIPDVENSLVLCEIKSSLTDQSLGNLGFGFQKFCLVMGKLNFNFDYSSIFSITLLQRQIYYVLGVTDSRSEKVSSCIPTSSEDPSVTHWNRKWKSICSGIETTMLRIVPVKHTQIGAFIAGPSIRLSLRKEGLHGGNVGINRMVRDEDLHFSIDVCNTEIAVSPGLRFESMPENESIAIKDAEPASFKLKEPEKIEIPESHNEIYSCKWQSSLDAYIKVNGLSAYLAESSDNQHYPIIILNPTTIQFSYLREDLCSFSCNFFAFSAVLHWMASGLTLLLFMDEFFVLVEVVSVLISAMFHASDMSDFASGIRCSELINKETVSTESEIERTVLSRGNGTSFINMCSLLIVDNIIELKSMDIVLHKSRKISPVENHKIAVGQEISKMRSKQDVPECGLHFSLQKSYTMFYIKEKTAEVFVDFSGIRSVVFRNLSEIIESYDQFKLKNLPLHYLDCLYEVSVSHFTLYLWLRPLQNALSSGSEGNPVDPSTSGVQVSHLMEGFSSAIDTERARNLSSSFVGFSPNSMAAASGHWGLSKIALGEIYLAGCPVKNILVGAHKSSNLGALLSFGEEFMSISCQTQGGSILLETTALVMFVQYFASYFHCIMDTSAAAAASYQHAIAGHGQDTATVDAHTRQAMQNMLQQEKSRPFELLTLDLSRPSLVLVARDDSGRLQEIVVEVDVHINLAVENMRKKISFGVSNFSVLSQFLCEDMEQKTTEIQIPHFSSVMASNLPSRLLRGDPEGMDGNHPFPDDASCSHTPGSQNESYANNLVSQVLHLSPQNYILRELNAYVEVESPVMRNVIDLFPLGQVWVGTGSISGFDMTISLTEIQMILSSVDSLSGVFAKEPTANVEQTYRSSNQEYHESLGGSVPDGAIVAIQDIHQHMYVAVEGAESKFNVVGAVHYSLVGQRALFRVNYQKPGRWKSSIQWFSLISLHAKSASGESLRLNCHPGSGFVDISSSDDTDLALWKMLPHKPETYEGDVELESYSPTTKSMFNLVNKKNDCAIAFVDGVLEFVRKPGNPLKWKVLQDPPPGDDMVPHSYLVEASRTNLLYNPHSNVERTSGRPEKLPCINITIDKVTMTIVHELSDRKEKFPLLQGSISTTEFTLQILHNKARVMISLGVVVYYFDAQRNIWREFVHPVEMCIYYRSRFGSEVLENVSNAVPVHLYVRAKEWTISVTELSLDILLFVIGKLDLAGPFAVRSAAILANCCKIENQTGLTLLCHFYDNQDATIAARQSTTIFLRNLALVNQPPEASFFSIQLAERGAFSTSLIHLSLVEVQAVTWRTRIVSLQDSKSYPGPFVVVEVSRRNEDGLSIVVSPLLRIHNETDFSIELRFQRPQQKATEFASLLLGMGDTIDDSLAAFSAVNMSGGVKKALASVSVGNFLFSFRPKMTNGLENFRNSSVEWSDDFEGGKAVRLSGIFDKLSYQVRRAFSIGSAKHSLSTVRCSLKSEDGHVANMHFLIQNIQRDVPVIRPDNFGYAPGDRNSPVALQEQKEIFLLPTVRVSNLLQSEIHVKLTDTDPHAAVSSYCVGNQAIIPCGSTVNFYANPATIYFFVTLTAFSSTCKPANSGDWVKKLQKQKKDVRTLDIELDFGGGKYFAFLRLSRGHRGILEATIFTTYTLKNNTSFSLFCSPPNQKPISRDEVERLGSRISPELGSLLPPKSACSWFMRHNKVCLKLLEEKATEAVLDLDSLSGLTEIDLEIQRSGFPSIVKLGVSLRPSMSEVVIPSQIVCVNPRYVVSNESEEVIFVRQCYLEDDEQGVITINGKQRAAILQQNRPRKKGEISVLENFLRKHRNAQDDSSLFIQFRLIGDGLRWSGPVCVASLGRFFLKFRRSLEFPGPPDSNVMEFAAVHVVEEGSTFVLHFHRPPNVNLPYRIENCLHDAFITYYQKDSSEPEILHSGGRVNYVWDDLNLPHKLVVHINDLHLLREINLDKVRAWKPFYRVRPQRGLWLTLPVDRKQEDQRSNSYGPLIGTEVMKLGYEVYADGLTRVLRICESCDSQKRNSMFHFSAKMQMRITKFAINLLELTKQETDMSDPLLFTPIVVMRIGNINLDSTLTDQHKYNLFRVESLSVDPKWVGAPFASMLRRHQSEYSDPNADILQIVLVLLSSSSNVREVKHLSIVLQPLHLNLDEETLMRTVPFWRSSLSDSTTPSQQYYFDHFEIHPIKIVGSFLPGESYSSYSSTQETLRSLLHSVIKIPAIKDTTVELNGVLVTHALISLRELAVKCAQHYSWYAMRAIYIAKGSPLLPPAFASIFDDLASSSLDVFFDPSSGLNNLPGLTLGTFKLISKFIDGKGFSGTKRYFGDLRKTLKKAGSNVVFAAVTEVSDLVLKGAEASGFNGMVSGFHQGILKLAMEPSVLGSAFMEGGPDRKIKLDRSPGVDELYIEGYLQAMLDTIYKQEYLRVRVIENQVVLKNLPPNSSLIDEIVERVKSFLVSKALLKGDSSTASHPLRHLRGESEWKIGPTVLTLCEHLFVSFAIRALRKQASKAMASIKWKEKLVSKKEESKEQKLNFIWRWGIGNFLFSGMVAYVDGRLCRYIPHPVARRIVSGFLLSFLERNENE